MHTWKFLAAACALIATHAAFGATPLDAAGHPTTEAAVAAQNAAVARQIKAIRLNAELTDTYWVKYYDWGCDGAPGSVTMNMYADYTWSNDEGYTGTWTKSGKDVVVTYDSGTTYTGVLSANNQHASGTMVSYLGATGCWTADRL